MDYTIPFRGLKEGKHQYEYSIEDKFFEAFPEGEIREGRLQVGLELIKRSTGLETEFTITGSVKVPCDRCLEEFIYPIEYCGKLFFEFGQESGEVTDELVMLSPADDELDVSQYIYEFINLSLPLQKVHPVDFEGNSLCNQEMINRLNNISNDNNDEEKDDPRWDKLKDLIN